MMAKRQGRGLMTVGLGLALVLGVFTPSLITAKAGDNAQTKVLWSKDRSFQIPVNLSSKDPKRVREMILHVSDDGGYTWKKAARTTPDSPIFPVHVIRDGEYSFAVQTIDVDGKLYPNGNNPIVPSLRVIVDSTKPLATLEPTARRGSEAGVRWEVQDEHLLLRTLVLEYQAEGARDWRKVPLETTDYKVIGIKNWDAGTAASIRARLSIRDQAGNLQVVEQILPDGLAVNPGPMRAESRRPTTPQVTAIANRPTPPDEEDPFETTANPSPVAAPKAPASEFNEGLPSDRDFEPSAAPETARAGSPTSNPGQPLMVKSPQFALKYDVQYEAQDVSSTGPALVELWTTRDDGASWTQQPPDSDKKSPYNVDLRGDGKYGLWLVVQSSTGLGDAPPQPGDRPQSWVEVDSTDPVVSIDRPIVGKRSSLGKLLITWSASDTNLAPQPISLFYREDKPDAQWIPIPEATRIENKKRFIWKVPTSVPPKFHIKVEAKDKVGRSGMSDTTDYGAVIFDRAKPRGRIIGLDQAGGTARE